MALPFDPPIEPMLAKASDALPSDDGWLFEPKWDGFRALVFRDGDSVYTQSRDLKPLDRYFPELAEPLRASLPERCVLDGEIVIARDGGLDFEALLLRIHPAASRVKMLAEQSPASFVAWDLLALGDEDLRAAAAGRAPRGARARPRQAAAAGPPHAGHPRSRARRRLVRALRGRRARRRRWPSALDAPYQPGKRAMLKIKHARTADCVVAGFRWHKNGPGTLVGSLLLGLYDDDGHAAPRRRHVVVHRETRRASSSRSWRRCARTRSTAIRGASWADGPRSSTRRASGCPARTQPLEPRQGPVVGAAPHRARLRGRVRPPAGRPLPPRGDVRALAPRQAAARTAATTSSRSPRRSS